MYIKAATERRSKLLQKRTEYVTRFNAQKEEYDKQKAAYVEDYENYVYKVAKKLTDILHSDLEKLPGAKVEVLNDKYSRECPYFICIEYNSPKHDEPRRVRDTKSRYSYYRGLSWHFYIYFYLEDKYSDNPKLKLRKEPQISAELLESDDYSALKATYELFTRLDNLNWETILNRIINEVPKEENYVTTNNPGFLDTSEWDNKIDNYDITRIIGKDLWVKVDVLREDSYDRWSEYSNAQGVDGTGWIKVDSQTNKFYTIHWLSMRDSIGNEDGIILFSNNEVSRALRRSYRLKKIYFRVIRPVEYLSTEEITQDEEE